MCTATTTMDIMMCFVCSINSAILIHIICRVESRYEAIQVYVCESATSVLLHTVVQCVIVSGHRNTLVCR